MTEQTQVVVVGAGPVGLMLAGELRLRGAAVTVLERRELPSTESRASTLHARTMEIFDARGLLDELGTPPQESTGHFGGIPLDLVVGSRFPGQWKVPQTRTEAVLHAWAAALGADIRRGWRVDAVDDYGGGVEVCAETGGGKRRLRADFVVGCDGMDSTVRRVRGVEFAGSPATRELLRADVAGIEIAHRRFERLERGFATAVRNPAGITRVMVHRFGSAAAGRTAEPDFAEIVAAWHEVTGEDIGHGKPLWVNAFDDASRQVRHYRSGRVLFAGDAAHQQMPSGGQALNLGLQDAVNLGWKLAAVLGGAPDEVLDSYHRERHAVGERVLANIRVQTELLLGGPEVEALRTTMRELIGLERVRAHLAGMISGVDVRYPAEPGEHPLLGARLPDLLLREGSSTTALLRDGRGLVLGFGEQPLDALHKVAGPWSHRVGVAAVRGCGPAATDAVLVRPDGHVAWAGAAGADLEAVLGRWFGAARTGEGETWTPM
ncbi:FAD-dependent monooxygenase [Nocardia sp. CDC159]|uniref:FAD-dependent monooxygenase n=1 Tax=Nocardia pulmonis TaxID=2951408 RepID=A0A9X2J226_9NOCA|nr:MULTISPECIES: FAD-dependent monooxygenase [Nocardia]MCM6778705.1 FAD-dependent monooxygenase [Nocardia pulmonis]MCM6791594.1 FAD-dependent monooxygenase [Nocardia sp. CDC159]